MNKEPDEVLVKRAKEKDQKAFEELVSRYEGKVYGLAYRMMGNREDAADVLQETFLDVHKSLANFREESKFSTWLYRITVNTCLNKRKSLKQYYHRLLNVFTESGDNFEHIQEKSLSIEKHLEKKEQATFVQNKISKLANELRVILVLRDIEGFAYTDIADICNLNIGTVKSRLFRARELLKKEFEDIG